MGARTLVLHGRDQDLAAAGQTIREIGDVRALDLAIEDALPGPHVQVFVNEGLSVKRGGCVKYQWASGHRVI